MQRALSVKQLSTGLPLKVKAPIRLLTTTKDSSAQIPDIGLSEQIAIEQSNSVSANRIRTMHKLECKMNEMKKTLDTLENKFNSGNDHKEILQLIDKKLDERFDKRMQKTVIVDNTIQENKIAEQLRLTNQCLIVIAGTVWIATTAPGWFAIKEMIASFFR